MLRLYAITCLLALVIFDANTALAQRGYRTPTPTPPTGITGPTLRLPAPTLGGILTLPERKPVLPIPPVSPQHAAPPDAGMCCPCPGRNGCSDACCAR